MFAITPKLELSGKIHYFHKNLGKVSMIKFIIVFKIQKVVRKTLPVIFLSLTSLIKSRSFLASFVESSLS